MYVVDGTVCNDYKVLVMSSLDRIVDILKIPDGGARFLMWSPDGTRVATTGNDESLTLWNFYSDKKSKYFRKINGSKDKSSMESKFGNQFRKWCYLKWFSICIIVCFYYYYYLYAVRTF